VALGWRPAKRCPCLVNPHGLKDDAAVDARYLDVVPLPDGGYRIYYEARLPDESTSSARSSFSSSPEALRGRCEPQ
jgi:hypothetical protein